MKKRRSIDLRQQALSALAGGMSRSGVCQAFGIHRNTLYRWHALKQQQGHLEDKPVTGCPRKITPEQEPRLVAQLQAYADATLEQHQQRWHTEQGQWVSRATMARAIERVGWTRKKRP